MSHNETEYNVDVRYDDDEVEDMKRPKERQQQISDKAWQEMLGRAYARGRGEDDETDETHTDPIKLCSWSDYERAIPTAIVRSALFGVIRPGRRPYLKDELLTSWKDCEIRYTGQRLNQYDQDVWMQALHFAREQDLSDVIGVRFSLRGFVKAMGNSYSGRGGQCAHDSMKRMRATALSIRTGTFVYVGGLIDNFAAEETTGLYVMRIDPAMAGLFGAGYTKMEAEIRRRLSTQIGRHLYGYIQGYGRDTRKMYRILASGAARAARANLASGVS